MNILQAYIKIYGKLFIHIVGLPGSNSDKFAKELAKDLNITYFDIHDYMSNDYPKIALPNSTLIENKYDIQIIDTKELTSDINIAISKGVVLSSYGLSSDVFKIKSDIHIILDISKKFAIQNILTKNPKIDPRTETFLFNHYLFDYLNEIKKTEKINKFFNLKGNFEKEMNDLWEYCMWFIDSKVYSDEAKTLLGHSIPIRVPTQEAKKNFKDYDITRKKLAPPSKFPYTKPQKSYKPKRKQLPNDNVTINKTISNQSSNVTLKNKGNNLSVSIDQNFNKKQPNILSTTPTDNSNNNNNDDKSNIFDISLDENLHPNTVLDDDDDDDDYTIITDEQLPDDKLDTQGVLIDKQNLSTYSDNIKKFLNNSQTHLDKNKSNNITSDSPSSIFIRNEPKKKQNTNLNITVTHPNKKKFSKKSEKVGDSYENPIDLTKPSSKDDDDDDNDDDDDELTITITHPNKKSTTNTNTQGILIDKQSLSTPEPETSTEDSDLVKAAKQNELDSKNKDINNKKKEEEKKQKEEKKLKLLEEKKQREEEKKRKEEEKKRKADIKKILEIEEKKRLKEEAMLKEADKKNKEIPSASEVLSGWQTGGSIESSTELSSSSSSIIKIINIE